MLPFLSFLLSPFLFSSKNGRQYPSHPVGFALANAPDKWLPLNLQETVPLIQFGEIILMGERFKLANHNLDL
jgi:hypothetical protein